MMSVLNRLVGRKKIVKLEMIPSRMISAPAAVSSQPSFDLPSKKSRAMPTSSGMSERPNAL